jgi:DNA-directed RNA polymerase I, II, and III subunit RPABC3
MTQEQCADRLYSKCYVSFGGLLMCLDGPHKKLSPLRIDHVYMLLKK